MQRYAVMNTLEGADNQAKFIPQGKETPITGQPAGQPLSLESESMPTTHTDKLSDDLLIEVGRFITV
jgi:hypothetical protein